MNPTSTSQNGAVQASSESRFNAAHYSEALTTYTVGWKDPENLPALLEFIAPSVPVGRRFEFKKAVHSESFLTENDDVRAIGSAFKRVEYRGSSVQEKTLNKGLTIRVDHDEVAGDDWQERYVQLLLQRLYRNEVRRALSALDSIATVSEVDWTNGQPDRTLREALARASDQSGLRPNRILIGESAWDLRQSAYESDNNAGAFRAASMTHDQLSSKLMVDQVRTIKARIGTGAQHPQSLMGNAILCFNASAGVTKDEPSNLKRFITPSDSGSPFRVYVEEHAKYTDLTVEHYSNLVVTSELGAQKIVVNNA